MVKRISILVFFIAALGALAGAEELNGSQIPVTRGEAENTLPMNTIALSVGVISAELSYERAFNTHFSLLGSAAYNNMIFASEFTVSAKARWYPFGGAFHLDLGAGFIYGTGVVNMIGEMALGILTFGWYFTQVDKDLSPAQGGFLLQPGLGWKIDPGKRGGIVIPITVGMDIRVTKVPEFMPTFRVGMGYSF